MTHQSWMPLFATCLCMAMGCANHTPKRHSASPDELIGEFEKKAGATIEDTLTARTVIERSISPAGESHVEVTTVWRRYSFPQDVATALRGSVVAGVHPDGTIRYLATGEAASEICEAYLNDTYVITDREVKSGADSVVSTAEGRRPLTISGYHEWLFVNGNAVVESFKGGEPGDSRFAGRWSSSSDDFSARNTDLARALASIANKAGNEVWLLGPEGRAWSWEGANADGSVLSSIEVGLENEISLYGCMQKTEKPQEVDWLRYAELVEPTGPSLATIRLAPELFPVKEMPAAEACHAFKLTAPSSAGLYWVRLGATLYSSKHGVKRCWTNYVLLHAK